MKPFDPWPVFFRRPPGPQLAFPRRVRRHRHPHHQAHRRIHRGGPQELQVRPGAQALIDPSTGRQPQEVGISGHQTDTTDRLSLNERVSQEMFDGIIREVVEETGVPADSLADPALIGVSRREMNVRPAAFFFIKCNIDSSDVYELYSKAQDGYESTKLYVVSVDELRGMSQRMTGCHRGGFALYESMKNAAKACSL